MNKPYSLPEAAAPARRMSNAAWAFALLVLGVLALAIRWYYISHAVVYHPIRGDAIQYHAYAWNLAEHGVFSKELPGSTGVAPDSFRDPGYPVFLAFWMKVFPDFDAWYAAVLIAQCLLGALTVVLLVSAARGWLRDRWLIGAGVLMALWPHSVAMTSFVLSETLFGFLCALAVWALAACVKRPGDGKALVCGTAFGLASLTNAILLPFAPLLALGLLWRRRVTGRIALALIVSSLVLPACWSVRNMQLPPGASSSGRALLNLVQGAWPEYHQAYRLSMSGDPEGAHILQMIGRESDVMLANPVEGGRLMMARMANAPLRYLGWYLSKPALLWGWSIQMGQGDIYVYPTARSPFNENPLMRVLVSICQAINPLIMLFALAGLIVAVRVRTTSVIGLAIAALAAYVTLIYTALQAEPRYSIPFRGIECLLAVYALQILAGWTSNRRRVSTGTEASQT